jgi:N-acetylglucosaminyl-diphospho-decaprenol L-rhamnosyltransferase
VPVDIAFVTVNYNTLEYVKQLAGFFRSLDGPFTFSFTVVDNNSRDGSQEFLRSHPEINYIQAGKNLGYGRAINRGVALTESKYICVTNTDVILNREALVALWRFMEEHPDASVCAPRLLYEDGRDQGMVFERSLFAHYAHWFAKLQARHIKTNLANATAPVQVDGVMGAFFLIRRSIISPPALFDEDFFFFYEDSALSHALANRGVPCFVLPKVTIIHIGGKSRSEASVSLFYKSKYLYLKKFYGSFHAGAICRIDRARILRKWLIYSMLFKLFPSEQMRRKQRHYFHARNASRLR